VIGVFDPYTVPRTALRFRCPFIRSLPAPERCIYSDRRCDQRVSFEAGLAWPEPENELGRPYPRGFGILYPAGKLLTHLGLPCGPPMMRRCIPPPIWRWAMGSGVARQCSRNRCLGQWTVWIPYRGRRGGEGRANSKKDLVTGPIRGFCAPHDGRGSIFAGLWTSPRSPGSQLMEKHQRCLRTACCGLIPRTR
jgi:hypothetical protein